MYICVANDKSRTQECRFLRADSDMNRCVVYCFHRAEEAMRLFFQTHTVVAHGSCKPFNEQGLDHFIYNNLDLKRFSFCEKFFC